MQNDIIELNIHTIQHELAWLSSTIDQRLNHFFKQEQNNLSFDLKQPPDLTNDFSKYALLIKDNAFGTTERLLIIAALAIVYKPEMYDRLQIKNKTLNKNFTEFGGFKDAESGAFIPTLRTVSFLLNESDLLRTVQIHSLFESKHIFITKKIINIAVPKNRNIMDSTFSIGEELFVSITEGKPYKPNFSSNFPANILDTPLDWDDLVLEDSVMEEIRLIDTWLENKEELATDTKLYKKTSQGFKCLFYGLPGTGKTLTASLLGKKNNLPVYRIDLSQVVSKYIGETEKNLGNIFDLAENKNWILFFDEAESLFSKRTSVSDSKDKFANQETAYLLQRVENFNGLIVLATNLKPNIDMAFSRRIQSVIQYAIPSAKLRKVLWEKALNGIADIEDKTLGLLAEKYELAGGSIKNIIQFAWLHAKGKNIKINKEILLMGIRRELSKDGKTFNKL